MNTLSPEEIKYLIPMSTEKRACFIKYLKQVSSHVTATQYYQNQAQSLRVPLEVSLFLMTAGLIAKLRKNPTVKKSLLLTVVLLVYLPGKLFLLLSALGYIVLQDSLWQPMDPAV